MRQPAPPALGVTLEDDAPELVRCEAERARPHNDDARGTVDRGFARDRRPLVAQKRRVDRQGLVEPDLDLGQLGLKLVLALF